jgi:hypothetical protein
MYDVIWSRLGLLASTLTWVTSGTKVRDSDLGFRVECGNGHLAQPGKRCLGSSHLLICNRCVECMSPPTEPNRLRVWVLSPIFEPLKLDGLLLQNQVLEFSDLL